MYYHHQQAGGSSSAAPQGKHHDAAGGGGPNGDVRAGGGGQGGWGRHPPAFSPGIPLPGQAGYGNGLLGGGAFGPPPGGPHHTAHGGPLHGGTHGHGLHQHHTGQHPHHPSFGAGGMHLAQQSTGGMGMGGHPGGQYGMGMYGNAVQNGQGSPPRQQAEQQMPMTQYWQHQLLRAEASRLASAPHHRARSAAVASRMTNKTSAITISDPNNRPASAASNLTNGLHKRNTLSVASTADRARSPPPPSESSTTATVDNADPATPAQPPAPQKEEDAAVPEPWTGLDLGGIRLKTLSTSLFTFSHITALYINHNALTTLPAAISNLRQLTVLDATGNELTSVPPELGVLCKLKDLLLFDNRLTTLPPELGTLYQLETLGIDGNPMEDRLRKLLAEEGTSGLIAHLRDSCPMGPPPPERLWIPVEDDSTDPEAGKQESFTALSYNILCHHFAPGSSYSYTPSWALDWSFRKTTILSEIVNASADIVCLQECDNEQFSEFFLPELQRHGYEGSHFSRSRARTMHLDEAKQVDGCATFWKDATFSLIETQVVEFNQVALQKHDMRTDDMFNRVMSRDNIANVCEFEFRQSGARLLVANSHIYWDHRYRDVKLVQVGMLLEELEKIVDQFSHLPAKLDINQEYNNGKPPSYDPRQKGRDIPLLLCVDLNSLAHSAVYDFLSTGEIPPNHEDFMSHLYGHYTNRGLRHHLGLRSSCASFGEMRMTNYTPTFDSAIDYIFFSHRTLKVTSVLGDVDRSYLDKVVGFPNAHFPSDHIPVFAQFRVKGQTDPEA